ncbi:hypothetical protein H9Q72_001552 [Fusarium xylarioides]|uniref:Uncharacterized protein n=1 Tax=Fusarium xylarioides TaxID=221167 RepID=A0A9P7L5U8_9HYPO|nr:hypothetical protein H9Q70_005484 [Fusarium xylarioides]KAG5772146.1 hypothetical protein H9Q72_001552 [Fusarium xylarioides]KAG5781354.1 hypothetical protein H9Q73_004983 [Fusarium xylarioides]
MSTVDKQMKQQQEKKSQDSVMLQIWLNEPEDVVSSTDTWSSQRALTKPRRHVDFDHPKRPKNKETDIAPAA